MNRGSVLFVGILLSASGSFGQTKANIVRIEVPLAWRYSRNT
jgi:hypothetical protein